MKKFIIVTISAATLLTLGFFVARPPSKWKDVAPGMSRSEVYSLIGQPQTTNGPEKGGVRWRSRAVVGRWELHVFFHSNDTVGAYGQRWRWNWW